MKKESHSCHSFIQETLSESTTITTTSITMPACQLQIYNGNKAVDTQSRCRTDGRTDGLFLPDAPPSAMDHERQMETVPMEGSLRPFPALGPGADLLQGLQQIRGGGEAGGWGGSVAVAEVINQQEGPSVHERVQKSALGSYFIHQSALDGVECGVSRVPPIIVVLPTRAGHICRMLRDIFVGASPL